MSSPALSFRLSSSPYGQGSGVVLPVTHEECLLSILDILLNQSLVARTSAIRTGQISSLDKPIIKARTAYLKLPLGLLPQALPNAAPSI
jgi:hypothetical protein